LELFEPFPPVKIFASGFVVAVAGSEVEVLDLLEFDLVDIMPFCFREGGKKNNYARLVWINLI
jgi:hypothetical protein